MLISPCRAWLSTSELAPELHCPPAGAEVLPTDAALPEAAVVAPAAATSAAATVGAATADNALPARNRKATIAVTTVTSTMMLRMRPMTLRWGLMSMNQDYTGLAE